MSVDAHSRSSGLIWFVELKAKEACAKNKVTQGCRLFSEKGITTLWIVNDVQRDFVNLSEEITRQYREHASKLKLRQRMHRKGWFFAQKIRKIWKIG
jgi:hypothetical protein